MDGFDEYLLTRNTEREVISKPRKCDECGEKKPDVDLWGEDGETGEQIWMCVECDRKITGGSMPGS